MADLSTLVFRADTSELEKAQKVVKDLVNEFAKVDKSMQASARLQAQSEALIARAAKDSAKARLDNSKAMDQELKSAIAADKADAAREKQINKTTAATEKATKANQENVSILQRQKDIYEFQTAGFSKGQAGILATAKATGQLSEELKKVLEAQKQFSSDPFDRSDSSLKRYQKTIKEATDAEKFLTEGLKLSSKQAKELSNDLDRLQASLRNQGKSADDVTKAQAAYKQQFSGVVTEVNKANATLAANDRALIEVANATKYLTLEDQKMAAALNQSNAELDKAGTDRLVKYEAMLRKSGDSQEEVTRRLGKYKTQLAQVQAQEQKRKEDNLARAASSQLTDIGVSLYSGQNPLTVLIQQAGQLADQLRLSGVEADQFAKVLKNSFYSMIPVIKSVGAGLLELTGSVFMDLGRSITGFVGNILGITAAVDKMHAVMSKDGPSKMAGKLRTLTEWTSGASAAGLAAIAVYAVAATVALYKVIQAENELTKVLALNTGAFGMSKDSAVEYSQSLSGAMGTTGKFMTAIGEMAKAGVFVRDEIATVSTASVQMQKYFDVAIEDTVKSFAKMKEKPVENMIELAKQTGLVTQETLKAVIEFEKQGKAADATAVAIKALADVNSQQVEIMKKDYNNFSLWVIELGSKISTFFSETFANLWRSNSLAAMQKELGDVQTKLDKLTDHEGNAKSFFSRGDVESLQSVKRNLEERIALRTVENSAAEYQMQLNTKNAKVTEFNYKLNQSIEKHEDSKAKKTMNLADFQKKYVQDAIKDANKSLRLGEEEIKISDEQIKRLREMAKLEWESGQKKPKKDPKENYFAALMREATDSTIKADAATDSLTKSQIKLQEVIADPRFEKLTEMEKGRVMTLYATAAAQEQENEALALRNGIIGKAEGLGKTYYAQLKKINDFEKQGREGFDPANAEILRRMLMEATPYAKDLAAYMEKIVKTARGFEVKNAQDEEETKALKQNIALRQYLIDKNEISAKAISTQAKNQLDLAKAKYEYEKRSEEIQYQNENEGLDIVRAMKAMDKASENYAAKTKALNAELFVSLQEQMQGLMGTSDDVSRSFSTLLQNSGQLSFANAVTSLNGLVTGFDNLIAKQEVFNKMREAAAGDTEKLARINQMEARSTIKSYGDITGAMKGFFKEGSKGYKALNTAEKVFRAFEMAMALKSAATRIAAEVAVTTAKVTGTETATAATASSSILEIAWTKAVNIVKGIGAILTQGSGDPYTAIPRMAAMAAIVAGLGIAVGGIGGGGGSSVQPSNQGTGTVFGDSEAKSESIKNSLGLLEDINTLTMQYSQQMAASLRNIESALVGVTNVILRSSGMEISARGIQPGTVPSGFGAALMKAMDLPGLGPLLGKVINALFGTKTTITGQGVMAQDATVAEIQAGQLQAGYYTDVNKKKKFLGITTSDKNSTQFDASEELSRQFAGIINGFVDVVKSAAPILGVSLEDIDASLSGFIVKIGKIDLKDLKGDEIKEKLMAVFGAAGDDIAMQTLKGFEKYQEAGEGYLETITRVASTVEGVRGTMDTLNSSMSLTVDGAMELADAFGGLEQFMQTTSSYLNAYYTDEERKATLARQGAAALATKGINISADQLAGMSNADIRKAVESTEADKELYAWAQNLAVQLAPLYELPDLKADKPEKDTSAEDALKAAEDAAKKANELLKQKLDLEKQYAVLLGDDNKIRTATLAIREFDIKAMDESLHSIQRLIWAQEDLKAAHDKLVASAKALNETLTRQVTNARAGSDKAYAALERAVNAEKEKAEEALKSAEETRDALQSIFDLLSDNVRELFLEVDSTSKMLASSGRSLIRNAISSGVMPGEKDLSDAIGAVRQGLDDQIYATKYEADRARLGFAIELDKLKGTAGEQLTEAERQLKAAEAGVDYLDNILKQAKLELDKLREIDVSISSVATAVNNLAAALQLEYRTNLTQQQQYLVGTGGALFDKSTGQGTTSGGQQFTREGLLNDYNTHMANGGTLQQVVDALSGSGYTLNQIEDMYGSPRGSLGEVLDSVGIPRFESGGFHAGGLAMINEAGPELVDFGSSARIYNAADTAKIMSNSSDETSGNYELKAVAIQTAKNARTNEKILRILDRLVQPGNDGIDALNVRTVNP